MSDEVVQKLSALQHKDRSDALHKLIFSLTGEERRLASSILSQRSDPLYVLPVELVLQIFQHLDLLKTWSLQRVCRRWQKMLSSDEFQRPAISRWHTEDRSDSGNAGILNGSIQGRVQHIRAITLGTPLSEKTFDNTGTGLQGPQPKLSQRRFDFKGQRIAYISSQHGSGDAVIVRDLVTGETITLRGHARERILLVVLTTALVGFVTFEGCVYVLRFSQRAYADEMSVVRLPSAAVRAIGGDELMIALIMEDRSQMRIIDHIVLYNTETGRMQSRPMDPLEADPSMIVRSLHSCSVLVDAGRAAVNVFKLWHQIVYPEEGNRSHKSLVIENYQLTTNGNSVDYKIWETPIEFETSVREYQFLMVPPSPTGREQEYRIVLCEVPFMGGLPFRFKASVLFDCASGEFVADQCDRYSRAICDSHGKEMNIRWKNQLYRPNLSKDWFEYIFYMNDTFMVSLEVSILLTQHSRIRVMCFDPDVEMEGSSKVAA